MKHLRDKLGDDAQNPTYIFAEPRVGYRAPKGEGVGISRHSLSGGGHCSYTRAWRTGIFHP